ncbi:MAG: sigma-70 family RNA polymerase sigma factor [Sporomusaceae bacterium]|nr:sigma-70 family RNA polymerase sigma factor [Sporomusaceae bacterium]
MLKQYLEELKNVSLLTQEEESGLWHSYKKQHDLEARKRIIESYQPLVFKLAMKWRLSEPVMLDTIQEGTIGLIEAVESYDENRQVAFSLFASYRIRGRMINYLKKEKGFACVQLDSPVQQDSGSEEKTNAFVDFLQDESAEITERAEQNYLISELKTALKRLPAREQLVLNAVYLNESEPKELAATLDMSLSYVYRLQKQGVRRLRGMLSKLMGNWH